MMNWLNIYKHLLPRARAWRITVEKQLRQFFEGLTGLPDDVDAFMLGIMLDLWPSSTTALNEWLAQFNIVATGDEATDRLALTAAWRLNEYQSPRKIQDTIQAAGFDVYIHEWWQQPVVGSPEPKNPFAYLAAFQEGIVSLAGSDAMLAGAETALSGQLGFVPIGNSLVSCDDINMFCDDPIALCDNRIEPEGFALVNKTDRLETYVIPPDDSRWPYFLYFGGETFPDVAQVPVARKNEFETLLLKICPAQQWLGLLVQYV
jgi:hypothetical protein